MFEPASRYFTVETANRVVVDRDERERVIAYKKQRFIPSDEDQPTIAEHTVSEGDRLDNITNRYLGDPTQFWRLCDTNLVLRPAELEVVGRVVRVAMPRPQ